jgi:hypothetical protein
MKALAARATRYRNRLEGRSGTLWESRYKSSVVQSDSYLLACCRYIELNPVRARMVSDAADYPWSSYRIRVGDVPDGHWTLIHALLLWVIQLRSVVIGMREFVRKPFQRMRSG